MALHPAPPSLDTTRCAARHEHSRNISRTNGTQVHYQVWNGSWFERSSCALQCAPGLRRVNYQPFVCGAVAFELGGLHG